MRRGWLAGWVSVLAALALGWPGKASAQGLISIPSADALDRGQASLDLEYDSAWSFSDPTALSLATVQYGVAKRLTMGLDVRLTQGSSFEPTVRPNFIYLLREKEQGLSVGVGIQNVGVRSFGEQPFLVLSQRWKRVNLHAGYTYEPDGGNHRAMAGAEVKLLPKLTWVTDYINGDGNFLASGLQVQLSPSTSVEVAYLHANDPAQEDGIFFDLGFKSRGR